MRLTLGLGDVEQIGLGKPPGFHENRAGHRDVVVARQPADHLERRIADRRQTASELGKGLGLDLDDQAAQHLVEQADMVLFELARAIDEEVGDAFQRLGTLGFRAMLQDVFELW
jgi:hypothetical protein